MRWWWLYYSLTKLLKKKKYTKETNSYILSVWSQAQQSAVTFERINIKLFTKRTKSNYIVQLLSLHLPLLCSHPSLTITTLVMLVGRVEDPGFPQGETQLCFSSFLHSALCRSLETGSWGLQPPSQWWLPISWKRVKISLILKWKIFSTCLNINPQVNIVEGRQWNWALWPS